MALFDKMVVFRQKGITDPQLNHLLSAVIEFLDMCGLGEKISVKWVSETINLSKYVLRDKNDRWNGYLDGQKIYPDFAKFVVRHFDNALGILFIKYGVFSIEEGQRFFINGLAPQDNPVILVYGEDVNRPSWRHGIRMTVWHELGHVFDTQPEERTEDFEITRGRYKHCVSKDCVMQSSVIPPGNASRNNFFCAVCQRYLKLFLEKNFAST